MKKNTFLNFYWQRIIFLILVAGLSKNINAQMENYGNLHIFSPGSIKVYGPVINTGASSNINNSGNLLLTQDFTNNGNDLDPSGNGTITFNGTTTQNINGTQSSTFYNVAKPNANDIIIGNNQTIRNTLSLTGGTFILNDHQLILNGPFTGTGTLTGSVLSGLIIGGNAGTLNFTTGITSNYLNVFTINTGASATLGDTLNIAAGNVFGTVTANGLLNANNNLILKSDVNGTARVAESYGSITGNVTVERYIPPRRAWRFINAPFKSSTQTIRTAWQEGVNNTDLVYANNQNPHPGYGTHITGNNNTTLGYDYNLTVNPSLKIWQNNNWSLTEPATATELITAYQAYCLFIRGSRAVNLSQGVYAAPDPTVLRAAGVLNETGLNSNIASQSFTVNAEDFIFTGNPYASSVDVTNVLSRSTGIYNNKFWVWDPKMNGSYNVGGYVTFANGIWTPNGSGSYPGGSNNLPVIQNSQAFMVQASAATGSVDFNEADKTATQANVFGRKKQQRNPAVYTNLMVPSADSLLLIDGVAAGFGNRYAAAVDGDDAQKLWNFDENIALVRDGKWLAIEFRPIPVLTDTIFYKLYLRQQPYVLKIFTQDIPENIPVQAWLADKYLGTHTAVNLQDTTLYNFTPNLDTNSYRNRFMLVFNRLLSTTPVPITSSVNNPQTQTMAGKIDVYPNPAATGSKLLLTFKNLTAGKYQVTIITMDGKALLQKTIQHPGGSNAYTLQTGSKWVTGNYLITAISESGNTKTVKLIIGN